MSRRRRIAFLIGLAVIGFEVVASQGAAGGAPAAGAKENSPCGGKTAVRCDAGLWCDVKGPCDAEDPGGVCVRLPAKCGNEQAPVCGCDEVTYENDCKRLASKMQKDHDGECRDEPDEP